MYLGLFCGTSSYTEALPEEYELLFHTTQLETEGGSYDERKQSAIRENIGLSNVWENKQTKQLFSPFLPEQYVLVLLKGTYCFYEQVRSLNQLKKLIPITSKTDKKYDGNNSWMR